MRTSTEMLSYRWGLKPVAKCLQTSKDRNLVTINQAHSLEFNLASINSFEDYEVVKQNATLVNAIATKVIHRHQFPDAPLKLFADGTNLVFACGHDTVIKIFPPFHKDQSIAELLVLKHLQGKLSVKTPRVTHEGEISGWPYIVMARLNGTLLQTLWEEMTHDNKIVIMRELGALIREVHSLPTSGLEEIDCHWEHFIQKQIKGCINQHRSTGHPNPLIKQIPSYLDSTKQSLEKLEKPVLLTGEYTPMNVLVKQAHGVWHGRIR